MDTTAPFKKTKHRKRQGKCFSLAGEYLFSNGSFKLVHAYTTNCGRTLAHAWIEDEKTDTVYDLVLDQIYKREEYYKISKPFSIKRYTEKEAAKMVVETGHWGPWDLPEGYEENPKGEFSPKG